MNTENVQKSELQDVAKYRQGIAFCLTEDYHMSDAEAVKAIRSTHLNEVLEENPEKMMSYPIKLWAGYVYSVVKKIDRMRICLEHV